MAVLAGFDWVRNFPHIVKTSQSCIRRTLRHHPSLLALKQTIVRLDDLVAPIDAFSRAATPIHRAVPHHSTRRLAEHPGKV
jgi:hypothetical protein